MAQFIKCKFRTNDSRAYTYRNDGDPVAVGDFVKVSDNRDPSAWKRVQVTETDVEEPTAFECKPILGKVTGEDTDSAILDAALGSDVTF
ncbi:MAG: hypothetical protein KA233_03130 [Novosphingobium sp.]|nr:hypothetical protein [Novosphingobium sp.]